MYQYEVKLNVGAASVELFRTKKVKNITKNWRFPQKVLLRETMQSLWQLRRLEDSLADYIKPF